MAKKLLGEFVDPPPSDCYCPMCGEVLQEPMLTNCCGSHFCKACVEPSLQAGKPCPNRDCNETEYLCIVDKPKRKKILELDVICPLKGRGCNWIGEVGSLEKHLDPLQEGCEYIDVKCTNQCGEEMERYELVDHLNKFCHKRPHTCEHCGVEDIYEVIVNDHTPECPAHPVTCANNCGDDEITRSSYREHLLRCPEQEVECEFSYAGCEKRVRRKEMAQHQHDDVYTHLSLQTAFASKQISERDKQLRDLCNSWEERFHEMRLSVDKLTAQHSQREQKLLTAISTLEGVVQKLGLSLAFSAGRRLSLKQANIAGERADVIVNASSDLFLDSGVTWSLNEASGGALEKQISRIKSVEMGEGSVICTQGGGALQCKSVIHAFGSSYFREDFYSTLVTNILKKAEQLNACSVALPAISAGKFSFDRGDVARVMVDTILRHRFTKPPPILSDIRIVILDHPTYDEFAENFMKKLN